MSNPTYPPPGQQPAGQAWGAPLPPLPPQPKKHGVGKILGFGCPGLVGVIVALGVVGALASGSGSSEPGDSAPAASGKPTKGSEPTKADAPAKQAAPADGPEGDVEITACEVADFTNWPSAKVTITNRSSKTSNYIVQVEFLDAGGTRLGDGTAAANNLDPGQSAKETAQGLSKVSGKITCEVADVTRYASF